VPLAPNWGRNHRGVALRIPMSGVEDTRVESPSRRIGRESRTSVIAAILAGVPLRPHEQGRAGADGEAGSIIDEKVELPVRWPAALDAFDAGRSCRKYLGEKVPPAVRGLPAEEEERFHSEDQRPRLRLVPAGGVSKPLPGRPRDGYRSPMRSMTAVRRRDPPSPFGR
jgi:glutamine synthetase